MPLDYLASIQAAMNAFNAGTPGYSAEYTLTLIGVYLKEHAVEEARVLEDMAIASRECRECHAEIDADSEDTLCDMCEAERKAESNEPYDEGR